MLITLQARHGNKWKVIAKQLNGRNGNAVKNRYWAIINKQANDMEPNTNAVNPTPTFSSVSSSEGVQEAENVDQFQGRCPEAESMAFDSGASYNEHGGIQLWNTFYPVCIAECSLETLNACWESSDSNREIELAEACAFWLGVPVDTQYLAQCKHSNLFEDEEYWHNSCPK